VEPDGCSFFYVFHCSVTRLKEEAAAAQMEPNEYAREKAIKGKVIIRQAYVLPLPLQQQILRIGNNMNQIAKRLHWNGDHAPAEVRAAFKSMEMLLDFILRDVTD
jgi:hypothetical protein